MLLARSCIVEEEIGTIIQMVRMTSSAAGMELFLLQELTTTTEQTTQIHSNYFRSSIHPQQVATISFQG